MVLGHSYNFQNKMSRMNYNIRRVRNAILHDHFALDQKRLNLSATGGGRGIDTLAVHMTQYEALLRVMLDNDVSNLLRAQTNSDDQSAPLSLLHMGWMNDEFRARVPVLAKVLQFAFYMGPVTILCGVTYGTAPAHKTVMALEVWSCNPVHSRDNSHHPYNILQHSQHLTQ